LGRIGKLPLAENALAEFDAFFASGLAASALFPVFRLDSFPVWAIIVIVMDLTVLRRFFDGVGMVRFYLCHDSLLSGGR
jgi:hypothetical protein